ncbi:MAG: TMEM165/GDT1 family protein [Candidatus Brockarchaeota archaeon]|nr:TMEM165/GDT1 family protein [Candidatus Brockarchaeota archaeon]
MDPTPLFASILLIILAELGDKTQLAIISLSSCSNTLVVFTGAMLAFIIVSMICVFIGDALRMIVPLQAVNLVSAVLFLAFGIYMILTREREDCFRESSSKYTFLSTFSMVALMEMGDKTQVTVIALAAKYGVPIMVYVGVIMAFIILTGMGVLLGRVFSRKIPLKYVKLGSGVIFLLFGIFFLFEFLICH